MSAQFPWREPFLAALREYPVLGYACSVVGMDRSTVWRHTKKDKDFADAVEDAMESGVDRAEHEAFRRGVVGFEEPVIDKGRLAYRYRRVVDEDGAERFEPVLDTQGQPVPLTVRKHSDPLLSLVLKGRRKSVYADRTEITNPDSSLVVDETARAARVAALIELARNRREAAEEFG